MRKLRYEAVLELSGWCVWDNHNELFVAGFPDGKVFVERLQYVFDSGEEAANALASFLNSQAEGMSNE